MVAEVSDGLNGCWVHSEDGDLVRGVSHQQNHNMTGVTTVA